jgi:hypothetical protein
MTMRRPNPLQWVGYAYGGRLPDRYREWVLHDITSRTWLLRFVSRIVVEALPWLAAVFVVLTLLTPLPAPAALGALILALLMSLYFTVTSADELCEARLVKHGYPPGTGKTVRRRRTGSSWGRWGRSG